jgi:amino acid adenylation domain-containing protein
MQEPELPATDFQPAPVKPPSIDPAIVKPLIQRRSPSPSSAPRQSIPCCDRTQKIPLSAAQQRIWLMQQLEPEIPFANRPLAIRLKGLLDQQILSQSLSVILQRHEALRTIFPVENGTPWQQILSPWTLIPTVIDLRSLPPHQQLAAARTMAIAAAQQPFDLASGPLIQASLLQLSESDHILLLCMHHIVFDGWSETLLLKELDHLYCAIATHQTPDLPQLPIQYQDFACWQKQRLQGSFLAEQLQYWQQQLGEPRSILELPADYPRSTVRTFQAQYVSIRLPASLTQSLKSLSQQAGVTLFMTLLAAFQTLLHRYTEQEKLAVGVPVAGRNRTEIEALIGVFMNTLVLQSDLSGNPSFRELLDRVRQVALGAYSHQELPFEKLIEVLNPDRLTNRWPLFQVLFNFRNRPQTHTTQTEITPPKPLLIEPFEVDWGMMGGLELILEVTARSEELDCQFRYPAELFTEQTILRLAGHFRTLLENVVLHPDQAIDSLTLITPAERHQVLVAWNRTEVEYFQRHSSPESVHELVEAQVQRTPDAIAVVFEDQQLTYQQLNQAANQLAHYLKQQGIAPDVLVGICIERSLEMVIGILATLKAGGAYVPLDTEYPPERLAFMVQDSQISVLLTQRSLQQILPVGQAQVLCLDRDQHLWNAANTENCHHKTTPDHLLYVMYTSGTTGRPKGVMITHRGGCNHLSWRQNYFAVTPADRILQQSSLNFDDSFWQIFEPLITGAQLVIPQSSQYQDPHYLIEMIAQHKITALSFVPSVLQLLLEEPEIKKCTTLKRIIVGGEVVSAKLQQRFFQCLNADLYNGYGPTEATVAVIYWKCQQGDRRPTVPIGRPISNTQIYLLDPQLQPVPIGVPGELYIGGTSLARGYLHHPHLTAEKFIPNPFFNRSGARAELLPESHLYKTGDRARYLADGSIEFLGRVDHQVKLRGVRIELGEIESALMQHPNVQQAVVIVHADDQDNPRLIAYVILKHDDVLNQRELRQFLQQTLPAVMIPSAFIVLDAFAITPNGKLDRQALPKPETTDSQLTVIAYIAPRTTLETQLAEIWQAVLNHVQIGIDDNFFDLGGHSLLATQVTSRIRQQLQIDFPLRHLFDHPTIAQLAAKIAQLQAHPQQQSSPLSPPIQRISRETTLATHTGIMTE